MEEGIIKKLTDNTFGFISPIAKGKDLFFLYRHLQGLVFQDFNEGDSVEFELAEGPKGPRPINISQSRDGERKWKAEKIEPETDRARLTISEVIEGFLKLTPDLIQHLRRHDADLARVHSDVFEHLVGELMASAGWDDVRLVGRNPLTHADILALHYVPKSEGIPFRIFVEVKRWKGRIGVEVFNQVLGAMVSERERHGWHGAIIVALGGASNTRAFSRDEYRRKGLEVKDKEDLMCWLRDYKPNADGLWLAPNFADKVT